MITVSMLSIVGMAACSPAGTNAPETAKPGDSATSEANSAPQVKQPKNLEAISDACQLLTSEQLAQLGAEAAPKPDTSEYGESKCTWSNDKLAATVALNAKTGTGPKQIFEQGESTDNFAPTEVDGYPAARVDQQSDLCRIEVGVSDTTSVAINYFKYSGGTPEMQDPCGYAEKIASEALKNIPAA